jgi:hypothetical protein
MIFSRDARLVPDQEMIFSRDARLVPDQEMIFSRDARLVPGSLSRPIGFALKTEFTNIPRLSKAGWLRHQIMLPFLSRRRRGG